MPPYFLMYLIVDLTLFTSFSASKMRMMPSPDSIALRLNPSMISSV